MPTIAADIALWLETRGLGTRGVDIFDTLVRDEPDDAILISEGGGTGADRSLDGAVNLNQGVIIIVRAAPARFQEGYDLAHEIYKALIDLTNTAIDGRRYIGTNPLGDVSHIGRDERDRWKWTQNHIVKTP